MFVFYPFFLGGYYLSKDNLNKILDRNNTMIAILIICIITLIIFNNDFNTYIFRLLLTGRNPYKLAGFRLSVGCFYRTIYYLIVFIIIGCILNLAPRKKYFYTKLGTRTLQVYFLHTLLFTTLKNINFYSWLVNNIPYWKVALLLSAIIVATILSFKIFEFPFRLINKCKFKFLTKETT